MPHKVHFQKPGTDPERSPSDPSPPRAGVPLSVEIEAGAMALWDMLAPPYSWDRASDDARKVWRDRASTCITAAENVRLDHQSQEEAKYEGSK